MKDAVNSDKINVSSVIAFFQERTKMNFDAFTKDIVDNHWKVFGTEVYKDGKLIHAFGDTKDQLHYIYSATKSVVSTALGIVYDRGMIDLDKSILTYLPKEKVTGLLEKQRTTFEKITIRRLLTMSVDGFPFRPEGENWLDFALSCEIPNPEEKVFNYNNINVYLVCVALTEILGCDLGAFIEKEIFAPLGITRYKYERSPEGYFYGASGMQLTVHDLSRIGLLYYNNGVVNGQRIISEDYVKMATGIQQMNREGGYGFYFWKYRDGFSINGKWKQKCYVLPKEKLIISYLADIQDDSHDLLESMERNILGLEGGCEK